MLIDAVHSTSETKNFAAMEKLLLWQQMLTCLILLTVTFLNDKYCHKISFASFDLKYLSSSLK